jgi:hypothetical protein
MEVDSKGAVFNFRIKKGEQQYGATHMMTQEELRARNMVPFDVAFECIKEKFKEILLKKEA